MPYYQSVLFLADSRYGWQEEFYQQAVGMSAALAALQDLARQRLLITSTSVNVWKCRVSQVGSPGTSWLSGGGLGRVIGEYLSATDCLLVRLEAGQRGLHRREWPLRGLPTQWNANPLGRLDAFFRYLTGGRWLMRVNALLGGEVPAVGLGLWQTVGGDVYWGPVADPPPPAGATVVFAETDVAGDVAATRVRVRGVQMTSDHPRVRRAVNGVFPIWGIVPNGVYWLGSFAGGDYVGGGKIQLEADSFEPIRLAQVRTRTSRKTGPAPTNLGGEPLPAPAGLPVLGAPTPPVRRPYIGPVEPPPPPTHTFLTLKDIAYEVFQGYTEDTGPDAPKVGVARVIGTDRPTYAWFLAGIDTNIVGQTQTQWLTGLQSYVGLPDIYADGLRSLMRHLTPDDSDHYLFGHSLGGMTAQSVFGIASALRDRVPKVIVGMGCPSYQFPDPFLGIFPSNINRQWHVFGVRSDPLIYAGPAGNVFWLRVLALFATDLVSEGEIFVLNASNPVGVTLLTPPDDIGFTEWKKQHNCYPDCPDADDYHWDGRYDPDQALPDLVTGPVTRFRWPPPPE